MEESKHVELQWPPMEGNSCKIVYTKNHLKLYIVLCGSSFFKANIRSVFPVSGDLTKVYLYNMPHSEDSPPTQSTNFPNWHKPEVGWQKKEKFLLLAHLSQKLMWTRFFIIKICLWSLLSLYTNINTNE